MNARIPRLYLVLFMALLLGVFGMTAGLVGCCLRLITLSNRLATYVQFAAKLDVERHFLRGDERVMVPVRPGESAAPDDPNLRPFQVNNETDKLFVETYNRQMREKARRGP
jgi:hypothetical protein